MGLDRARTPVMYPKLIYNLTGTKKREDEIVKEIDSILVPWVKEQLNRNEESSTFVDMMAKYQKNGQTFSFEDIYHNVIQILNTGYETSSLAISYAVLMLAMHPEVDQKLALEIREQVKDVEALDQEVLKRLPYLDMVLKETLRLFSVAPMIPREALADVEIKGIGKIPKGTCVGQVFFQLHRWKHIWGPDASEFNPDHFLPEAVAQRHPFAFLPFGHGPRGCIGQIYSMTNMKMGLINILQKYRFTTHLKLHELSFKFLISLKLNQKHMVKVHLRD